MNESMAGPGTGFRVESGVPEPSGTKLFGAHPFGTEPPGTEPPGTGLPGTEADGTGAGGTEAGGAVASHGRPERDPAAPAPLYVPRTPTGDAGVDGLLGRLADADHLATDGHMEVYEDVHRGLRDALTALDARPGPPVPPGPNNRS